MASENVEDPVDSAQQWSVDGRVATSADLRTEREFLALFAKRSGMYIGRPDLRGVTCFLEGYSVAASRFAGTGLDGFREWLMTNHVSGDSCFDWPTLITRIALPDADFSVALSTEQETRVLEVLFDLLDAFLAQREQAVSARAVQRGRV